MDNSQWASAYFDHGVDTRNRRVFLGDINEESTAAAIKGLYFLNTIDDKSPIELFICSYGGNVELTLGIYDILHTLDAPVHTFAFGVCQSAAPLLLAAGEPGQRWVSEHTQLMTHEYSDELSGRGAVLANNLKYGQQLDTLWNELLATHSGKDGRFWKSKSSQKTDFFFSAEQAIEWGLADSIWSERG